MFYGHFFLGKKGPLAQIWLVAHLERKLSRQQVFDTDIGSAIDQVITPKVKMSLRLTGHLLLGIVRIYAKKADYTLHDLERAKRIIFGHFVETEHRRHPQRARRATGAAGAHNVSTIQEEDEGQDQRIELELPHMNDFAFPPGPEYSLSAHNGDITLRENNNVFANADLTFLDTIYGDELNVENFDDVLDQEIGRLSRAGSVQPNEHNQSEIEAPRLSLNKSLDALLLGENVPELGRRETKIDDERTRLEEATRNRGSNLEFSLLGHDDVPMDVQEHLVPDEVIGGFEPEEPDTPPPVTVPQIPLPTLSESQIRQELAEERPQRRRRRVRIMVADDNTSLDDDEIRARMNNIGDIINPITFAPPTKQLMNAKELGSVQHIFNNPATNLFINSDLMELYSDHCVERARPLSDVPTEEEIRASMELSAVAQPTPEEMEMHRRSRASSVANSINADLHQSFALCHPGDIPMADQSLLDAAMLETIPENIDQAEPFIDNFNMSNQMGGDIQMQDLANEEDEDRENINPFAGPPPKRSRTEQEIRAEEQRVQRSTKNLYRLIKTEASRVGQQKINFNELVIPNATSTEQIRELPQERKRELAKAAAHQFYALLELRKTRVIQVEQAEAFKPIFVTLSATNA